jgi:2-polyprenyl-3-methyl-5-hydroxy-6-metoxy-1,4-benzoquinol methylase
MNYQQNYSLHFPATKNLAIRQRKATKIIQTLFMYLARDELSGLMCLDLGCSVGIISQTLAAAGASIVGVDIDSAALRQAASEGTKHAIYILSDVGATPFPDETFDILVCSQVYEHSPSLDLLGNEINRVLKTEGVCFFSGPNRWAVIEEHYHLPLLSWMPKPWANRYLRWSGRGTEYYENPRSARELRASLSDFTIYDMTPEMLKYPERFAMESEVGGLKYLARWLPEWVWTRLGQVVPNFNWLLVKDKQ